MAAAVDGFTWSRLRPLLDGRRQPDERGREAKAVLGRLDAALRGDELAQRLAPALHRADQEAYDWVAEPVTTVSPPVDAGRGPVRGSRTVASPADLDGAVADLRSFVREHDGEEVVVEWRVRP